jgi:hypothetical protein
MFDDGVSIVALISQHMADLALSQRKAIAWVQPFACPAVTTKSTGKPSSSASRWIFVVTPPQERARAFVRAPFFCARGRLLMRPHDGRIDHQILIPAVADQFVEHLFLDPAAGPAAEPLMHTRYTCRIARADRANPLQNAKPAGRRSQKDGCSRCSPHMLLAPPGRKSLTCSHCTSLNSYRLTSIQPLQQIFRGRYRLVDRITAYFLRNFESVLIEDFSCTVFLRTRIMKHRATRVLKRSAWGVTEA